MKARVAILGSTGSVGRNALDVIRNFPDRFEVFAIAAHSNWKLLAEQVQEFKPHCAILTDENAYSLLKTHVRSTMSEILCGNEALAQVAGDERVEIVVGALAGSTGLLAYLEALRARKRLALANKEPMVMAGEIMMRTASQTGAEIIPVDSEHSAIFQAMRCGKHSEINRLFLTASGGPFHNLRREEFATISPEQAKQHPTWKMGEKITVDSATLMNKALEIIEAGHLFDIPQERISIVIHPQSIVHSMVEFCDGSIMAQMSRPDMRLAIQFALCYPERTPCLIERLNFDTELQLSFFPPDAERFPAVQLGHKACRMGGTAGAVLNAANELAVAKFLQREISFDKIVPIVATVLDRHKPVENPSLEDIFAADSWARREAEACCRS